jgi:hypothetical protein
MPLTVMTITSSAESLLVPSDMSEFLQLRRALMRTALAVMSIVAIGCDRPPDAGAAMVEQSASAVNDPRFYREMAKHSWGYLDAYYQPATGFVNATPDWFNTTLWDLGGQLLAFMAAKDLGLMSADEYAKRTGRTLATLESAKLYDGVAYNRIYSTRDGSMNAKDGAGWSATDLGRFLLALKILAAREPSFAAQAERVARRNDFRQIAKGGYLHGRVPAADRKGRNDFQEGRIGYEQYVAAGFHQWGVDVANAMNVSANATPVTVQGVPLLGDKRRYDRLLSEPFVLYGLELGLTGEYAKLAQNLLKAQEARFAATGQMTIASEDAMPVKPFYFYYHCVYCNGQPFVVGVSSPKQTLTEPRWVSTKAAFGWHALMPNAYTAKAIAHVAPALDPKRGWATGVFEKTGESTKTWDVNTAVVLMEIAWYQLRGRRPLMEASAVSGP